MQIATSRCTHGSMCSLAASAIFHRYQSVKPKSPNCSKRLVVFLILGSFLISYDRLISVRMLTR